MDQSVKDMYQACIIHIELNKIIQLTSIFYSLLIQKYTHFDTSSKPKSV